MHAVLKRAETAFQVAKGKYVESGGNLELVMQTAEAFGRGLFTQLIGEKPKDWTLKEWLETITRDIFNPLGTGATITHLTSRQAKSIVFRSLLQEKSDDLELSSLFTYGFMRGMLKSAFPKGEVIMESTMAQGAPVSEFIFKTNATVEERWERERVKTFFATTMKM